MAGDEMETHAVAGPAGTTSARGGWAPRAAVLPAIGVALLPKCPLCVMLVLGSLGLAHPLHETVFALVQGATLLVVLSLLALRTRTSRWTRLALGAAGACGVMLGSTGLAAPALGYAGAVLLAGAWLVRPRADAAPSCGCAATAGAVSE
jgi:hypothetical protein